MGILQNDMAADWWWWRTTANGKEEDAAMSEGLAKGKATPCPVRKSHDRAQGTRLAFILKFLRMDPQMVQELAARLGPRPDGEDTWICWALTPELHLAIILIYLPQVTITGALLCGVRMAHSAISVVVWQVCGAFIDEYAEVISTPTTPAVWLQVAEWVIHRWQFHHTLGALHGKHVATRCPRNDGSTYSSYK